MTLPTTTRNAIAVSATLLAFLMTANPAAAQVAVTVNGADVDLSPTPIVRDGRVFVPLRGVFERLGASVVYDNGQIDATGNGRDISLHIGSTQATVAGQPETIDVAPFIIGASTYVPLRFISEALGASVNWDSSDDTVSIATSGSAPSYAAPASYDSYADAPPPLPTYQQPYVPGPGYIWQPGYWALGAYGYYWVPGTWVLPPQPGYSWTPGYWASNGDGFHFFQGYWALAVGFYGGINYGAGYFGNGYSGGQWYGNQYRYNSAVTRVDTTIVKNVYVNNTTINNYYTTSRVSYNGGRGGVAAKPTAQQLAVAHSTHLAPTLVQRQHIAAAGQDRRNFATENHGVPPVVAIAKPLNTNVRPAGFAPIDKVPAPVVQRPVAPAAPAVHTAPVPYRAPQAVATPYHAPAPVIRTVAPPAPVVRPVAAPRTAPVRPAVAPRPVVAPRPAVAPRPVVKRPKPPATPKDDDSKGDDRDKH